MKKSINLLLWFSIVTITAFTQTRSISVDDAQIIANRNAATRWGKVSPAEPIIYYSADDKIVAYRFNYAIDKPFPDKNTVLQECNEGKQNGNRKAQWGNVNYSNILMSARTDLPVNLEYGLGLSSEYAYNEYLMEQAKAHLGLNYTLERIYYINAVNVWHHYTNGIKDIYVKAHAPSKVGDYKVFQTAISEYNFFCSTGDYNEQWDQYLYGEKSMSKGEHFIVYHDECCPFYDWSYGCSPTAAAMLFGYWDNMSMYSNWNFSKLVDYHFERSDPVEGDIDTHCPNVMAQLAIAMDTDLSDGTTQREDIAPAYNSVAANNGYYFDVEYHTGGLPGLWIYEVVDEIDNDKPVHVSISGHSVLAVGYNDDLDVATHYTHQPEIVWISFLQVQAVYPTNPVFTGNDLGIELIIPDGDQNYYGTGSGETMYAGDVYEITWDYDPSPGSYVSLYYHTEHGFGTTWELITSNTPNDGTYDWAIPSGIDSYACRIKIVVYDSDDVHVGSDGSYGDFQISSGGSIYTLFSDNKVTTITNPDYYQFSNPYNTWCAVGVRPNSPSENWSIKMFSNQIFSTELVSSTTSDPVDFVVMDRHHTSSFTRGIKAYQTVGSDDASLEFEGDQETLSIGTNGSYSWQAGDVVEMYDVYLTPGVYTFDLDITSGSADLDFGLFGSTDGTYYKNKEAFLARSANIGYTIPESFSIAVTTADYYGLCVWANDGNSSTYTIDIHDPDPGTWEGDNSIYWGDANNWSFGTLPDAATDVTIPDGTLFDCMLYYGSASCNSITVNSGAVLNINGHALSLMDMSIDGSIGMLHENSTINIYGDVEWNDGSTLNFSSNDARINVYGDWNFNEGANVNPGQGSVDFRGTSTKYIRCYSDNCSFYNLRNYKTGGAALGLSATSTKQLEVFMLTYLNAGTTFISYSSHGMLMKGSFNYYGTFDFNTGSVTFDGTNIRQFEAGSGTFNNVIFNSTGGSHMINGDMVVTGDLTIEQGYFSPDTNTVFVAGDWTNNVGNGGFIPGTGRVIFNGGNYHQYCSDETFNILEIDKSVGNFKVENTDVECAAYDWTEGGVDVTNGSFTANDLLDNAIQGGYYLNTGGMINLTNSGSGLYVDLKGDIHIYGGTMTVSGSISEWPYQEDASIEMSGGVLVFTDCGIIISNNTYALTDNITGGSIRTSVGFSGNRADFTPTAGTFEFYGTTDTYLSQSNGCTLHNVVIDKAAISSNPEQPDKPISKADRIDETMGDGAKANNITLSSNFAVTNDINITGGVLNASTYDLYVGADWVNDVGASGFIPGTGTVLLDGTNDVILSSVGSQNFNNLTIDKASIGDAVSLSGNLDIAVDIVVNTGALYSYANNITVDANVNVNTSGLLYIMTGGTLGVGVGLGVQSGGYFYAIGTSVNPATITHASTGNYNFNIYSGALMGAQYALFDYMSSNGVFLRPGSLVHPTYSFNYCTFQNGTPGYPTLFNIATDESFTSIGANFPDAGSATNNVFKYSGSTGQTTFQDAVGAFAGESFEYDPGNNIMWDYTSRTLDLTVFLEGPFDHSSNEMFTDINSILPLNQPFNPILPYYGNPLPDWYYTGSENVGAIPNEFVMDWVLVQLRDATSAAAALPGTAFETIPAFVLNTGEIVALDGVNPLTFLGNPVNDLFVVIWHRHHLGIISSTGLTDAGGVYTYDFSSGSGQVYGGSSAQVQLSAAPVMWGMMAGDGNGDGDVGLSDKLNVWYLLAGQAGYNGGDFNDNGEVDNTDKNVYWVPNLGEGSYIPE